MSLLTFAKTALGSMVKQPVTVCYPDVYKRQGLEAARVAAKRGYDVTVYEASDHLGGQIVLAAAPPRKDEIMRSVEYYEKILPGLGVKVELNHAATAEDLNAADAAIVAVGAHDVVIPVPGADSDKVVSSWDVLAGKVELTGRVAVIGGGLVLSLIHISGRYRPGPPAALSPAVPRYQRQVLAQSG